MQPILASAAFETVLFSCLAPPDDYAKDFLFLNGSLYINSLYYSRAAELCDDLVSLICPFVASCHGTWRSISLSLYTA